MTRYWLCNMQVDDRGIIDYLAEDVMGPDDIELGDEPLVVERRPPLNLDEIEERHYPVERIMVRGQPKEAVCWEDDWPWPCDTKRLVERVRVLEAALEAAS